MTYSQIISTYLATGTHAARPTTPNVASGVTCLYYETDSTNTFAWTGSAWVQINGTGGTQGMTQIQSQVLGSSAASIVFSSIPGTYSHLDVLYTARTTGANTAGSIQVQCNADTGANYDWQQFFDNNGASTAGLNPGGTSAYIGFAAGANAPAGQAGGGRISVPAYAGTTFFKTMIGTSHVDQYASGTGQEAGIRSATWKNTAAITSLTFTPDLGSFAAGTMITLYGLL